MGAASDRNERPVGAASDRNERPVGAAPAPSAAAPWAERGGPPDGAASNRNERPVGAATDRNERPVGGRNERPVANPTDRNERPLGQAKDATLPEVERVEMQPCPHCGRAFAAARLEAHMRSCAKVPKQREAFDPSKKRLAGTGAEEVRQTEPRGGRGGGGSRARTPPGGGSAIPKWERESAALRQVMEYNRELAAAKAAGVDIGKMPPPPATSAEADDRVECPHCFRKFAFHVYERHEPVCGKNPNRRR